MTDQLHTAHRRAQLRLTAARAGANVVLTAQAGVDTAARTIAGVIAPYGVVGYTSLGATIFEPGSITVPADLSRVKLLEAHDTYSPAVGILTAMEDTPEHLSGTFQLPAGAAQDAALQAAADKLRDGLSVGMHITAYYFNTDDVLVVTASELNEVSLVTIPAFNDARVLDVAAARKDLPPMTLEQLRLELTAGRIDQAEFDRQAALITAAQGAAQPAPEAPPAAQPVTAAAAAPAAPTEPQAAPVMVAGRSGALDLRAASRATLDHLRNGAPAALAAALEDVLVTDDAGEGHHRPQFVGELWTASKVRRPLIDAMNHARLTGVRIIGWRWVEAPQVEEYAGEKTPIASNTWKTEPAEADAQMFAGGWDIERKYIDLGESGIVEVAYAKATDDYKRKSEAFAARKLVAASTALGVSDTLTAALATLGVAAAGLGSEISYVQFGSTVWAEFVNMKEADAPWWLRNQGAINLGTTTGNAGGISFSVNPALGATSYVAGDGQASTWYETPTPIYVRAENIPQGGIDLGVFGYGGIIINDKRAIFSGTVVPTAGA